MILHQQDNEEKNRCIWVNQDPLYLAYHDHEWGVPIFDSRRLFEFLILEGAQAGLSWITVLKKRSNYQASFDHFDPEKIARYDQKKLKLLLANPGIIRHPLKIQATIGNAQAYLQLLNEWNSFSDYLWHFVDNQVVQNNWESFKQVPATNTISDKMSKDLKKRGFKFVGSTICYAFMQAVGMVNDHTTDCFRHQEIKKSFWVYILHCNNDNYYTGYTTDLARRYQEHLTGTAKCKYTRSFKPVCIAQYWQINGSKAAAMKVERFIKTLSKQEKELLILYPHRLSLT
jgi:DNA-3-methyladenine glycosylase I